MPAGADNCSGVSRGGGSFHHPIQGLAGFKILTLMTPNDTWPSMNGAASAVRACLDKPEYTKWPLTIQTPRTSQGSVRVRRPACTREPAAPDHGISADTGCERQANIFRIQKPCPIWRCRSTAGLAFSRAGHLEVPSCKNQLFGIVGFRQGRVGGDLSDLLSNRPAAARARSWRRLRRGDGCPAEVAPGH